MLTASGNDAGVDAVVTSVVASVAAVEPRFHTRVARTDHEREAYFRLRRAIFCEEQRLFTGDDRDEVDATATPVICLAQVAGARPRVIGVVRIWEQTPGDWWGGRLGVDAQFRTVGAVGRWLVQCAVGTARAWGAQRFRATVQRPNVAFFRRLRWQTREEIQLFGHPHHLMEADLACFPPTAETRPSSPACVATSPPSPDPREVCDDAA